MLSLKKSITPADFFVDFPKVYVNIKEYETFEEAKLALFEFIEGWYNRKRIHSAINYQIPYEIEKISA